MAHLATRTCWSHPRSWAYLHNDIRQSLFINSAPGELLRGLGGNHKNFLPAGGKLFLKKYLYIVRDKKADAASLLKEEFRKFRQAALTRPAWCNGEHAGRDRSSPGSNPGAGQLSGKQPNII